MTPDDITAIKKFLSAPRKIVITSHYSPDGDAIGSSLGLYHWLKKLGHEAQVVVPNAYAAFLQWLPGNKHVVIYENEKELSEKLLEEAELIFSLDYNILKRMEELGELVAEKKALKILIDHHPQPGNFADYMLSDISASSTAQLVYEFMLMMGDKGLLDVDIAQCLYTGIITDTGGFRFSSTSAKTHEITAELLRKGVQPHILYSNIYDTNRLDRLKLIGYCLSSKLEVFPEYKTALLWISAEELKRFNVKQGDTEGLVNYGLSVEGVVFSIFIKEDKNMIKLSLRSKGTFDVNQFARAHFHGGGHLNAAGGKSDLSLTETVDNINKLLPEYERELKSS